MRTIVKGHSIRKLNTHCPRGTSIMTIVALVYKAYRLKNTSRHSKLNRKSTYFFTLKLLNKDIIMLGCI